MQTQPYFLENGWVKNADTGEPVCRLDELPNGKKVFVIAGNAIPLDNIYHILRQVEQEITLRQTWELSQPQDHQQWVCGNKHKNRGTGPCNTCGSAVRL